MSITKKSQPKGSKACAHPKTKIGTVVETPRYCGVLATVVDLRGNCETRWRWNQSPANRSPVRLSLIVGNLQGIFDVGPSGRIVKTSRNGENAPFSMGVP